MLSGELLKELLRVKLKIADCAINSLPEEMREKASSFRDEVVRAVHEATGEYAKNGEAEKKNSSLKNISIM